MVDTRRTYVALTRAHTRADVVGASAMTSGIKGKDKCSIEDCSEENYSRGWCRLHYYRWYHKGNPETVQVQGTKHGMCYTSEYDAYRSMIKRCYNPKTESYKNYGGRGITVCDRWRNSFEAFYADMGTKPSNRMSLDRINNNGNYEPSNCRWATPRQQTINRRERQTVQSNNSTGVTGVSFDKRNGKYRAYINNYRIYKHLGYFSTIDQARVAVQQAESGE